MIKTGHETRKMPNLYGWIQYQLKKGHKPEHIKDYLIRIGHPQKVSAYVDKVVEMHRIAEKRKTSRKILFGVIASIMVLLIAVLIVYLSEKVVKVQTQPLGVNQREELLEHGFEEKSIRGEVVGIENDTFTLLSKGELINVVHNVPERHYVIKRRLSDGSVIDADRDDLLPGIKVVINAFIGNGQTIIGSVIIQEVQTQPLGVNQREELLEHGFEEKSIRGEVVGIENDTFTLLSKGELINVVHNVPERHYVIKRRLSDGSVIDADRDDLLPGIKVVINAFIGNGQTIIGSVIIQDVENIVPVDLQQIRGRLMSIEGNVFKVRDEDGEIINITNAPGNDFTLNKKMPNGTLIHAERIELVPEVRVTITIVVANNQTLVRSVVIKEKNATAEQESNRISGRLVEIKGNAVIVEKEGNSTTVFHNSSISEVLVLEKLDDGTLKEINFEELKIGRRVVVITSRNGAINSIILQPKAE